MALFDRMLQRLLAKSVDALVRQSLAEYFAANGKAKIPRFSIPSSMATRASSTSIPRPSSTTRSSISRPGTSLSASTPSSGTTSACLPAPTTSSSSVESGRSRCRCMGRDIVVGEGAWLASNVTVVGPCTIGEHAVVGVGSLVLHDVEPYTVVAGVPAAVRRTIPRPEIPQDRN